MTLVIVLALAVGLCAFVALPLLYPEQADPLPDYSDPVLRELQEERDALFHAIRELEARDDLAAPRRSELRARYEAKAAGVLRAIDDRETELTRRVDSDAPRPREPARRGRVPWAVFAMVGLAAVTAASLSEFVFPRVSGDQTVTTFFEDDLAASQALRDLRRAADRDPSTANLLALADAYWRLEDAAQAEEAYRRVLETAEPVPAVAFRRLGFLAIQEDLARATALLEQARALEPTEPQTLATLGEIYLALGDFDAARDAFTAYRDTEEGAADPSVAERLAWIDALAPVAEAADADPTEENLLALADAYWEAGLQQQAVAVYFRILTDVSPDSVPALSRTAEALFLGGRPEDAVRLFERARDVAASKGEDMDPRSLLLLGNAYFATEAFADAIDAWEAHLAVADDPGRVPDLIASARARLAGDAPPAATEGGADAAILAQQLYAANCATCHGASGQGGSGPALVGNPRARDESNVASIVRFGRGRMPGFGAVLDESDLELVVEYVTQELSRTAEDAR